MREIGNGKDEVRMRRTLTLAATLLLLLSVAGMATLQAASKYADAQFEAQWKQGEAITPNFWGPLSTAKDGQQEPYKEAPGGARLVQYFDKGRMELTNGAVTNGLLATEIIKGQVQTGDATFQPKAPPAIPIAGDPDNAGPTYLHLSTTAAILLADARRPPGTYATPVVSWAGTVARGGGAPPSYAAYALYDSATHHNVSRAFGDYRDK